MKKNIILLLIGLPVFFVQKLQAQLTDLPVIHDTLWSDAIGEKRPLEIVLPAGYDPASSKKYEVLYTTDGEYTTKIVSSFVQFLGIQFLPPIIVVSVPNTSLNGVSHREREMLPTHIDQTALSGGASNFLAFFKKELLPYINKKYPNNGSSTLYGSSFAGVFTMYTLLTDPGLFQSYLLADPALWWDQGYLMKLAKEKLGTIRQPISVLITGREGPAYQYMGIGPMDTIFHNHAPANLHWKINVYGDETHNSMIFRTVYDGLKYTYSGYSNDMLGFHPMNGIIVAGQSIKIYCDAEMMKDLRYTTDGSEPLSTSTKIDGTNFMLTGPASLTVKSFCNRPAYNKIAKGNFTTGVTLPPSALARNGKPGGFRYSVYEGNWTALPDFKKLKVVKTGTTAKDFDIGNIAHQQKLACLVEGQLQITKDGYYVFGFAAEGGSRLSIGKQVLIDNDSAYSNGKFRSYIVPLAKGFYPIRMEYVQQQDRPSLRLLYGMAAEGELNLNPIPLELEYSSN